MDSAYNCYNSGKVTGLGAGGLIHISDNSNIYNSYNVGNIDGGGSQFSGGIIDYFGNSYGKSVIKNVYNTGNVIAKNEAGGIAGGSQGNIYNSYNFGKTMNDSGSGGIVGQFYPKVYTKIENCYNAGVSTGGGIAGWPYGDGTYILKNNYYLKGTAEYGYYYYKNNIGAEPLSEEEMPSAISVINGDNAFVEDTNNINNGYPILKWQAERENN